MSGAVLGLIAMGFVLIFKATGIFNLAQGQIVAIGAYFAWVFLNDLNLHPALAIFLALVGGAVIGLILARFPFGPLTGQPMMSLFIVSLGLMVLLGGALTMAYGVGQVHHYPSFISPDPIRFADMTVYPRHLFGFGMVMVLLLVFTALFRYTRFGLVLRAACEDSHLARSMGINLRRVTAVALAVGSAVAALGGVILGMSYGVSPGLGGMALATLAVVLVGGMDSILGAILAGLLIGVVTSMSDYYIGHSIGEVSVYIVMLVVLLIRPYGILGQKRIERV